MTEPHPTIDRERNDIDSGRTGDKIAFPDPAAAPLVTDAEASGNPPTAAEMRMESAALGAANSAPRRHRTQFVFLVYFAIFGALVLAILAIARLRL